MIFNGDVRGLAGFIYNNPPASGMRGYGGFIYNNPSGRGLRGYGVEASDVGGAIGAGTGSLLQQLFPQVFPGEQPVPYTSGGVTGTYQKPSWWAQQSTGTKFLIGGLGLLGAAAVIVKLKK